MMGRARFLPIGLTLAALLAPLAIQGSAIADPPTFGTADAITDLGTIAPGQERFWHGPFVELGGLRSGGSLPSGSDLGSSHCRTPGTPEDPLTVPCFRYTLRVNKPGQRLRIALDHPALTDIFGGELRAPDGTVVAQDSGEPIRELAPLAGGLYSFELFVPNPSLGEWTFIVMAHDVSRSQFRLRAKLEPVEPTIDTSRRMLLPDLRPAPPFEVTVGVGSSACEEGLDDVRCLRFSQGPQNIGAGPLDLVISTDPEDPPRYGADANGDQTLIADQYQEIHYSDGTVESRPAGQADFHVKHWHWHHSHTGNYRLFPVIDPSTGAVGQPRDGPKQGFCLGDYAIVDWTSFSQQPRRRDLDYFGTRGSCAVPTPAGQQMGLTAGWSDVYPHFVPGNYVRFHASDGDGLYVLQTETNPPTSDSSTHGPIHESNYNNNLAYTYIEVCGNNVNVLERGYGRGPFDLSKVVVEDGRAVALDSPKTYPSRHKSCG